MNPYSPKLIAFPPSTAMVSPSADWRNGLLVRSTNWLGDALMTLPAVYQMARKVPAGKKVFVLTPANLAPMWRACPFVDEVVEMAGKHVSKADIDAVKRLDAGVAMVLPNSFGSAMDVWKCGVPIRCGRRGRWRGLLLTHRLREWPRGENVGVCHQLSYYLELATMLGDIPLTADCPPLAVDGEAARALGMADGVKWLAIAPGAAFGPAKQWPKERFAEVAKWFAKERGRVVIVGGPKEAAVAADIAEQLPSGTLNLAGKTDMRQLMAVLAAAAVVVANDSGAMHLTATLGKSGVALFGSTDPVATGPIGGRWSLLVADTPCRPCFKRECTLGGDEAYKCLKSLSAQTVIEELMALETAMQLS